MLDDLIGVAAATLSPQGLAAYEEFGLRLGKFGRGPQPLLAFLKSWPSVARMVGEELLPAVEQTIASIHRSPNGRAIAPFLESLPLIVQRLKDADAIQRYFDLCLRVLECTSGSIHGVHKTYASPSLPDFLECSPQLLQFVTLDGLVRWTNYGLLHYADHPQQQRSYFGFQSADSHAVLQRERPGALMADHVRQLDMYLRALWQDSVPIVPYSTLQLDDGTPAQRPYAAEDGLRLPDALTPRACVSGLDRYRASLAHMAGHRRWSIPMFADNLSPMQRMATEYLEDARMDRLAIRNYPGLARVMKALHPAPEQGACNPQTHSCFRHRLAMFSRALLCTEHGYTDPVVIEFARRFDATLSKGDSSTAEMATLALAYVAQTRQQSDQLAVAEFNNTEVDYRDDNRHLWLYHELSDDEESFDNPPPVSTRVEPDCLPPHLYQEWDYLSKTYRPQSVSQYESLHPSGSSAAIDHILERHQTLRRRLKRLLDVLKPQDKVRQRYQENGCELDLDIALRALTDLRAGSQPDTRIQQTHTSNGRSFAVTLLLDLSESLNSLVPGTGNTVLQLSQESVALLAWTVDQLGDPLSIAGFNSDTREEVHYWHIKGFGEPWEDPVKARMAAMRAAYSTRLGAAMRHAAHTLAAQKADKKLLLVLTDGQPSDVDVQDPQLLIADSQQSVRELNALGIDTFCINLDAKADGYVKNIFGKRYVVIDDIRHLPEKLPRIFMTLTR